LKLYLRKSNMHQYIPGKIVNIINQTPRVKRFFWQPDDIAKYYSFVPGQFAIIHFPDLPGTMPYRSYSIAGIARNTIEFCISLKEEGEATALLWNMNIGDALEITEAKGDFILKKPIEQKVCFIATGTGIAPFIPMINHIIANYPEVIIDLIYGNRIQEDILYHAHWKNLAKNKKQFNYFPVLSRESWNGLIGHVHQVYLKRYHNGPNAHFYICGWKEMISETRKNLKTLGYNRKQYFIESYN